MKNYVNSGEIVTIIAPRDVLSGELLVVGELVGFAQSDAAEGSLVALVAEGVYTVGVTADAAISVGDPIYKNGDDLTATESGNRVAIAVSVADPVEGIAQVNIKLG